MSRARFAFETGSGPQALPPPEPPVEPGAATWWTRAGYLLAGLLLAGTVLGSVNPEFGFHGEAGGSGWDAHRWPWDAVREADGRVSWRPESAWIFALSASALALLVAAFASARVRAVLGLLAAGAVGVTLLPPEESLLPTCGLNVAVALLFAAAVAERPGPDPRSPRRLALVGSVVLAGLLFLPLPPPVVEDEVPVVVTGYRSLGVETLRALGDLFSDPGGEGRPALWRLVMTLVPGTVWLFGLLSGLLVAAGLGRPWARWALGLALLALVLDPPAYQALAWVADGRERLLPGQSFSSTDVFVHAARGASETIVRAETLMLLPLALGLIDALRPRRTTP